jgi:hypothetical protein
LSDRGPLDQDDWETLEAELRSALQQRRAALERMQQTQAELEDLMRRARGVLARETTADDPEPGGQSRPTESAPDAER